MIPPGPPHLAGRRGGGRQRPSFDSLLFWGAGRARKALPYRMAAEAERLGIPRSGRHLSVSVSFGPAHAGRLRPGFAGPSCQRKGFQDMGGAVRRCQLYSAPVFGKTVAQRPVFPFVCEGEPCINALGPPAGLQAAGPVDASSRDSLAALSAAATVQAPHPVQCVRSRWAFAALRRWQDFVFKGEPCFSAPFSLLYAKGRHGTSTTIRKEHGQNIADSGRSMDV